MLSEIGMLNAEDVDNEVMKEENQAAVEDEEEE